MTGEEGLASGNGCTIPGKRCLKAIAPCFSATMYSLGAGGDSPPFVDGVLRLLCPPLDVLDIGYAAWRCLGCTGSKGVWFSNMPGGGERPPVGKKTPLSRKTDGCITTMPASFSGKSSFTGSSPAPADTMKTASGFRAGMAMQPLSGGVGNRRWALPVRACTCRRGDP